MCGISGLTSSTQTREQLLATVRHMGRYLHHRGPDAWGEWVADGVALGHNRLAILDLEGGAQPMACASGEQVIVFNGEIYNFREVRSAIRAAGGTLQTDHSDTEAIVEGYRLWGDSVFARLDGMFACAIWSPGSRQLLLARDRLGIKPLYYCRTDDSGVAFASEPKALVGTGLAPRRFEQSRLPEYFLFRAPLQPGTFFSTVQALQPGCVARFDARAGTLAARRFADIRSLPGPTSQRADGREVQDVIGNAVGSHLVADVEVGVFLSGGVDSSIVTALAARKQRVRAFNISTGGPLDEAEFARQVARHVGVDLHSRRVTPRDMIDAFDDWAYFNDDPVADPSALALMLLAQEVRGQGLKVMLSGEGADELFGGYRAYLRFLAARSVTDRLGRLPPMLNRLGAAPAREYLGDASAPYWGTAHITTCQMRQQLLGRDPPELRERLVGVADAGSRLRQAMLVDQRLRLPSDLLMRTDRATMAWSIEARVPLLANEVLATSWRVADRDLSTILPPVNKPLLKGIASGLVPRSAIYRRKVGFDLPLEKWLADDFGDRIRDLLTERHLPGVDYAIVSRWYAELCRGGGRLAGALWAWFVLEMWYRRWIEHPPSPRATPVAPPAA